eukprot:6212832-Pleurochrysis_carterae.AAC.2
MRGRGQRCPRESGGRRRWVSTCRRCEKDGLRWPPHRWRTKVAWRAVGCAAHRRSSPSSA